MIVSVIIPTHNSEATLERALKSVRNQTTDCGIEILLCDDHSKNLLWLLGIADKYNCQLLHVKERTGGPNFGRNLGIKVATGDYIAFLDHDDQWLPDKLENQIKAINDGAEFIYSSSITKKE
jgi:glycosyltransferase involved in cell wall biosynthesis